MVTKIKLDKIFEVGTTYKTHERVCYLIKKLGTNDTSAIKLVIDNKHTGSLIQNVAPAYKTNSTIVGPLSLEEMYYVIPPETDFYVSGTSGKYMRAIGTILLLAPGESVPGDLMARFNAQFDKYRTYVSGSYAFGTDEAWSNGTEITLLSLTPKTIETYLFNNLVFIEYSNMSPSPGDIMVNFYIDDNPLENLYKDPVKPGIDLLSIPAYNGASANEDPFTLRDYPIELKGDHTLKVTAKNVSGADITPPTGTAISLTIYLVCDFIRGS